MSYTPRSQFITILDRNIIVHESNLILATRLDLAQKKFLSDVQEKIIEIEDPLEVDLILNYCLPLAISSECINGEMFSPIELAHIPDMELDKLFNIVKEINPHWFPGFRSNGHQNVSIEEEEKKKET